MLEKEKNLLYDSRNRGVLMKAIVLVENGVVEYKEVPKPDRPGDNWTLVKVAATGICGSDIHRGFGGGAYQHPLIMGHEFSGTVEEPCAGSAFKTGDRVTVFPLIPCHSCVPCQTGDYAQCMDYDYLGSRRDGAFAEYVYAPDENLVSLPDHVEMLHAAMTEPCAVALHGANKFSHKAGATAVVFGAGAIGNMVAQWLRIRGARKIMIVDIDKEKLNLAGEMGFIPIDASEHDPVQAIFGTTSGNGADCVVEAVGLPKTFLQAVQAAARFGEVVFLGNIEGEFRIGEKDFSNILRKEIRIYGTWNSKFVPAGGSEWDAVLSYMDREIEIGSLISHSPPLSEGVELFRKMVKRTETISRVVFTVD